MNAARSALEIRNAFTEGRLSAQEITQFYLDRIQRHDPKISSFLHVCTEYALQKAKALDEKRAQNKPLGPLAAVPIGVKDNINVKGTETTCGSKILQGYVSPYNATAIDLIEKADGIIIGKTNCDEFAMGSSTEHSAYMTTKNPWNLACTPGGSSGGSAASVAAGLCPIALGSDTGGSVRQPGAFCGIAALKPTYGRISRYGLVAYGSSLDQIGPMTKTVEDIGLIMQVIGHPCRYDSTSVQKAPENYLEEIQKPISGMKIGVPRQFLQDLRDETKQNFYDALKVLESLGATVCDVDLSLLKYSLATYYILATAEASTNLARYDGIRYGLRSKDAETLEEVYDYTRREGFGKEVKRRILLGTFVLSAGYQDAYYRKAQKVRKRIIETFDKTFTTCDLIAMPTVPHEAFPLGSITDPIQMYLQDIYTISVNLAGIPAINVPSGFTKEKMPLGLQLLGPQLQDVRVCRAAYAYQMKTKYYQTPIDQFKE